MSRNGLRRRFKDGIKQIKQGLDFTGPCSELKELVRCIPIFIFDNFSP